MKKFIISLFLFFSFYNLSFADYIYYYGDGCPHCANVAKYFEDNDIQDKYTIQKKEIYFDETNRTEFMKLGVSLGLKQENIGVPFLFDKEKTEVYIGDEPIIDHFRAIEENTTTTPTQTTTDTQEQTEKKSFWSFLAIMLPAALADSINPCAFAVMLLLLGSILSKYNSYRKMYLAGFLFILAIFISYLAMGIGIYRALSSASNIFYIKLGVGILGIVVGLANLKDYFAYGKGFVMEVPISWRPQMKKIIDSVTSPLGAFFIGFLISLFLLPCTSGPYFTILGYLSAESSTIQTTGYIYLVLYNLVFILPMFIIILLVGAGHKSIEELKEYKEYYKEHIHLIVGILMILLGAYIILDSYNIL